MSTYECDSCPRVLQSWPACEQHMNDKDHWIYKHECETCSSRFKSKQAANQHMDAKNHWAIECDHCSDIFDTEDELDQHLSDDHFYCADCQRGFSGLHALGQHMASSIHWPFECEYCSYTFACEDELDRHQSEDHAYCAECRRGFSSHNALRQHLVSSIHCYVECDHCSNAFETEEELELHQADEHFYCSDCRRHFAGQNAVRQHLASSVHWDY